MIRLVAALLRRVLLGLLAALDRVQLRAAVGDPERSAGAEQVGGVGVSPRVVEHGGEGYAAEATALARAERVAAIVDLRTTDEELEALVAAATGDEIDDARTLIDLEAGVLLDAAALNRLRLAYLLAGEEGRER